ncbi:Uncharacterized protein ALO90_05439 [Pseudomonas amygdali pv. aesculi]|nr:Uncharacterized protein ALO90_05439 [Pseudomonas amygdali pv. aesculi]
MAEVEDVAGAAAVAGEDACNFLADGFRACVKHGRVHVALQRNLAADTLTRFADVAGPVQAQSIGADVGDAFQPQPAAFGEHDDRHLAPVVLANQAVDDLAHVSQREFLIRRRRQATAPAVEDLHGLGTGQNLTVQIRRYRLRQLVEQQVHGLRVVVEHGLGFAEVLRGAAFDHIGRQGPRAAGKADQRHTAVEFATDGADRVHHIAQVLLCIRDGQCFDISQRADGFLEARAFAGLEVQAQTHRVGNGQDVGEQNRRIQRVAIQWLQRDFTGELRVLAQAHEVPGTGAAGAVFRQVTACLAHHPYRRDVYGLLEQSAKETVVLQGSHVGIRNKSAGIFSERDAKGTARAVPFVYRADLLCQYSSAPGVRLWRACAICGDL